MTQHDEGFLFGNETIGDDEANKTPSSKNSWKMLIVDDEPDIHTVTEMALDEFSFNDRDLEIINAYSGAQAREILSEQEDIALVLLDVVMETQNAGLDTAKWIREELTNKRVQIVLRTGQAGDTPQKKVISDYDINGYCEKSELTAQKLFSTLCTSFRSYENISQLEKNTQSLRKIISSTLSLFKYRNYEDLVSNALKELSELIGVQGGSLYSIDNSVAAQNNAGIWKVIAGTNEYQPFTGVDAPSELSLKFDLLFDEDTSVKLNNDDTLVVSIRSGGDQRTILVVEGFIPNEHIDLGLIELFTENLALAYQCQK